MTRGDTTQIAFMVCGKPSDPEQLFSGTSHMHHLSKLCYTQQCHPISGPASIMGVPLRQGEARPVWNQIESRVTETLVAIALEQLGMNAAASCTATGDARHFANKE